MRVIRMTLWLAAAMPANAQLQSAEEFDLRKTVTKDPCNQESSREIVICAARDEARSPYRLPDRGGQWRPEGDVASVGRERNALLDSGGVGQALGPNPCSAVGPNGYDGCAGMRHKAYVEQYNQ